MCIRDRGVIELQILAVDIQPVGGEYADIPPGSGEREYLLLYGEGSGQLT